MCGIAGAFAPGADIDPLDRAVGRMCARMRARGPDGDGSWRDAGAGIVLGHRRLAILDLDARANQPMQSADGRYVIVFNGEIYNFRALRDALDGVAWRTESDTEVLLETFAREGVGFLQRLRGMFALALWDRVERRLLLARDPYGIKPLYLARTAGGWLFASQVKALLASTLVARAPDPAGQAGFWLLGSVPEPRTWFRDIAAVPAGHYQWVDARGAQAPVAFWDVGAAWREAPARAATAPDALPTRVASALRDSVRAHLVSDVPVGVFLSGGIDSSSLAALMRECGAPGLQGVTLRFREYAGRADDEAPLAAQVAARHGIVHHVRDVDRAEFVADWPRILDAMDQPSVDGVNTWYASKAAAEVGLKVVVSGVGGDELFQGYRSFGELPALLHARRLAGQLPGGAALLGAAGAWQARRSGNARWRRLAELSGSLEGAWYLRRGLAAPEQLARLLALSGASLPPDGAGADDGAGQGAAIDPRALVAAIAGPLAGDARLAVGQLESLGYLRNQLLRDSDWASMDHSVELRTPLVDAWLLRELAPDFAHFRAFPGKRLLAGAPATPLPAALAGRPKTGFSTPVSSWLDGVTGAPADDGLPAGRAARLAMDVARGCYAP
jgi:asparagine synthase (glutamine-hydrolysing)